MNISNQSYWTLAHNRLLETYLICVNYFKKQNFILSLLLPSVLHYTSTMITLEARDITVWIKGNA